jgi:hypothetical protein
MYFSRSLLLWILLACLSGACDGSGAGSQGLGSNLVSRTGDGGQEYLCIDDDSDTDEGIDEDDDVDEDADEGVDEDDDIDEDTDEGVDEDDDVDEGIDEDCFPAPLTDDAGADALPEES